MFDIGFWEVLFIGVIGLLVVGPDRLPALATHAGRWIGRIRLKTRRLKAQIQHELETEHLKSLVDERDSELHSLREEVREVKQTIDHAARTERYSGMAGPSSHPEDMLQSTDDGEADPGEAEAREDHGEDAGDGDSAREQSSTRTDR